MDLRMKPTQRTSDGEKRDWAVIALILLLGLFAILLAGEWALRFVPLWELDANALSRIDPNSDFLTNKPEGFIEPVDPSILNNPVSLNSFLTPGAQFTTRTPLPTGMSTSSSTTPVTTVTSTTSTATVPPTPTLFLPPYYPSSTNRPSGPGPTRTPTPTSADLRITKDDGVTTYLAGSTLIYTVVVVNNGTGDVTGAIVNDALPTQLASWSWACAAQNGGATGCDPAIGLSAGFSDSVNLPIGASITYTVSAIVSVTATGDLINTTSINLPSGYVDSNPADNTATDTDTFVPSADLQITKTDGIAHYFAGSSRTYTIVVSNLLGPSSVNGATVTDVFPAQISNATWTCAGTGGATCTAIGSGNINDLAVNLPVGSSVTYTVNVTIDAAASGDMTNTASVSLPVGFTDPVPGNNTATDMDFYSSPFPNGAIGTTKDGSSTELPPGTSVTLTFGAPIVVVGGETSYDLVLYELPSGTGIMMDHVILQVSDGYNWYTIFNWGDGSADTNSNLDISNIAVGGAEDDNRDFSTSPASDILYNGTGVAINLDGVVPNGNYLYIRIVSPASIDGSDVDAIEVLP